MTEQAEQVQKLCHVPSAVDVALLACALYLLEVRGATHFAFASLAPSIQARYLAEAREMLEGHHDRL